MPGNVDTRIIQMQFENKQFEKNIARSRQSIDDLKKAMDFDETSKGLSKFSQGLKVLDFSGLQSNIQKLTDKFTGLGNAGEYVLSRIRASLESAAYGVERFIRSISIDQISVGEGKYDVLNKAVQTIIAGGKYTEEQAYGVMERIMAYTDQTSHNFQTMVGQTSALAATGMELAKAERLIEGIGNASTKAGAGATEAAMAMSTISKVIGSNKLGKLQFDQLNQTYRVVTAEWREKAIEAGLEAGTLEKDKTGKIMTSKKFGKAVEVKAKDLENTLQKGWFNADVVKTLYGYYEFGESLDELAHPEEAVDSFGKTAYLTGQRALTLVDAINAIKESVSSGWMETFRIAFGDVTEAAELFTNICNRIIESLEGIKTFRNDLLRSWRSDGGYNSFLDILLGDYWEGAEEGAVGFMDLLDDLGRLVYDGFVDFVGMFAGRDDRKMFKDPEHGMTYLTSWLGRQLANLTQSVENFMQGINSFFNDEIDIGGKATTRLEVIHEIVSGIAGALKLGYDVLAGAILFIQKIAGGLSGGTDALLLFLGDLGTTIFNTATSASDSQSIITFFDNLSKTISPVTTGLNDLLLNLVELLRVMLGLDAESGDYTGILSVIGSAITSLFDIATKTVSPIINFISSLVKSITELASGSIDFEQFGKNIGDAFDLMLISFANSLSENEHTAFLANWIRDLFGLWEDDSEEHTKSFFGKLRKELLPISAFLSSFVRNIVALATGEISFEQFGQNMGVAFDTMIESFKTSLSEKMDSITAWARENISAMLLGIGDSLAESSPFLSSFVKILSSLVSGEINFEQFGANVQAAFNAMLSGLADSLAENEDTAFLANWIRDLFGLWEDDGKEHSRSFFSFLHDLFVDGFASLQQVTTFVSTLVSNLTSLALGEISFEQFGANMRTALSTMLDGLADILAEKVPFISLLFSQLAALARGETSWSEVWGTIGESIKASFNTMLDNLLAFISEKVPFLGNWIKDLFGLWEDDSEEHSKSFFGFLHNLFTGGFTKFGDILNGLTQGMSLKTFIENGFGFGAAFNFLNTVAGFFNGTNLYSVIMAFLGVASLATLWRLISRAKLAFETITEFFDDVGGNLKQGFTGEYEWFGERLERISKALGIMVASVFVLGSMKTESLIQGILGLAVVMGAMFGLYALMSKNKSKMLDQMAIEAAIFGMAATFAVIAVGVALISLALLPLSLDPTRMITAILGLASILAIIGLFFKIMLTSMDDFTFAVGGGKQWNGVAKMAAMMFTLAGSVALLAAGISVLVIALTPLALTGWEGVLSAVIGFGAILAVIGVFMMIMLNQMDTFAFALGGGKTNAAGIAKMAAMMIILAGTIALLGVGIGMVIVAITPLAVMSWDALARAIVGLGLILTELGIFIAQIQKLNSADKLASVRIAGFAGFAFSLGILVLALTPLASMSFDGWLQAIGGLGAIMLELIVFMKLASMAKVNVGSLIGFTGFAASLAILIFALKPLAEMSLQGYQQAVYGLATILIELVAAAKIMDMLKVNTGTLAGFVGFAASLAILMFSLKPLSEMSPQGYQQAIIGLATVLLEVVVLLAIMKEMKPDLATGVGMMGVLIGLGLSMVLFGIAFNEVKDVPWQNIAAFAAGIAIILAVLGPASAAAKAGGIKGMLVLVAGLALVLGLLALMAPLVMEGIGSGLSTFAGHMAIVSDMFQLFATRMNSVDEGAITKTEDMVNRMKTLLGNVSGFNAVSVSSSKFQTALFELGTGLESFERHTKTVGTNSNSALELIGTLAGYSGSLDEITKLNIDLLIAKISGLGGAMMLYAQGADMVGDLSEFSALGEGETIDLSGAKKLFDSVIKTLGVGEGDIHVPVIDADVNQIGIFGAQLAALAGAMVSLESAGQGMGTGTDNVVRAITFFKELKDHLTDQEFRDSVYAISEVNTEFDELGLSEEGAALIGSSNPLSRFGANIESLGSALSSFSEQVTFMGEEGNVKALSFDKAKESLDAFFKLEQDLSKTGVNKQLLTKLGVDIQNLGSGLMTFAGYVSGEIAVGNAGEKGKPFDPEQARSALSVTQEVIGVMQEAKEKLAYVGGITGIASTLWSGRATTLKEIGDAVGEMGEGLAAFSDKVSGKFKDPDSVNGALGVIDSIVGVVARIGMLDEKIYYGNFGVYASSLSEFLSSFTEGIDRPDIGQKQIASLDNIVLIMEYVSRAIDEAGDIKAGNLEMFSTLTESLANIMQFDPTRMKDFEDIGSSMAVGIANGINSGTSVVTEAASNLITDVYTAMVTALELSTGMDGEIMKTAGNMTITINRVMSDGLENSNPTIVPVLDTTQLEAGMSDLMDRYGENNVGFAPVYSIRQAGQLGTRDSNQNSAQYAIDLSGITSRITAVETAVNSLGNKISNIRVVLNSGVIAGGLTDQMDINLGRKLFYAGRKN